MATSNPSASSLAPAHRWPSAACALAAALAAACAPGRPVTRLTEGPMPESATALATPVPDPGCRATVQAPLAALDLSQVTVRLALDPPRGVRLVEVLSPALTPSQKQALRLAFDECAWHPTVDEAGRAETWTETYLRAGR